MSGICGIVNFDGAPVDAQLLVAMTKSLSFRGPDAQEARAEANMGFGHALLRTTSEAERELRLFSVDGSVWVTADIRIDGRAELVATLQPRVRASLAAASDPELLHYAYGSWGERCVEHLIGDFAFAIWDSKTRQLFCARDHFGVKPFFYADLGHCVVFSNTLNCVRLHPGVSAGRDDLAVADFLLFEGYQDRAATAYAGVRRLPSGHCVTFSGGGAKIRPFWTLRTVQEVQYRERGQYLEHFNELLEAAVADRLPADRARVYMSGGLDSPTIAATALRVANNKSRSLSLTADTIVYDHLVPDEERHFAALAAAALEIPIRFWAADHYSLFEGFENPWFRRPEPFNDPTIARLIDMANGAGDNCRVVVTGWDGDALLSESPKPYFRSLWKHRNLGRLAMGVVGYALAERRIVPLSILNRVWPMPAMQGPVPPNYPCWINQDLATKLSLRERWREVMEPKPSGHNVRPYAQRVLRAIAISDFFDTYDPGVTGQPLEYRHPLLDVRLVEYCLSLPPYPWCVKKHIMRASMEGVLPDVIRLRRKTTMAVLPELALLQQPESAWVDRFAPGPDLAQYVDRSRIPSVYLDQDPNAAWANLRPLSLNYWLEKGQDPN